MLSKLIPLLVIVLITCSFLHTQAAFPIHSTSVFRTASVSTDTVYIVKQATHDKHYKRGRTAKTFGILSIALFFYAGGILFGIPAIAIGASEMQYSNDAKTGFICGLVGLGLTLALIVAYLISNGIITF